MRYLGVPIGIIAAAGLALGCEHSAASSSTATTPPTSSGAATPAPAPAAAPAAEAPAPAAMPAAAPAAAPAAMAEDDAASEELRDHHRHHHHGGVTMFIAMSIDTLGVPPEKQARLEQIQDTLHEKMGPARDAERKLLGAVADGIANGKVDSQKVEISIDNLAIANGGVHAASVEALNELHAVLSPVERAALVEKVRAHYEVWRKVNAEEEYGSREKGSRLAKLEERLKLSPAQVDQLSAALKANAPPKPDAAEAEAHLDAFATAFSSDHFDSKAMGKANGANMHIAKVGAKRMVRFYEIVTPVLTADQRATLASHLRERLNDSHAVSSN